MVSQVVMLTIGGKANLLFGRWYRSAFQFLVHLDVFADFFFGLFIRFANTFCFTSGIGHSDQAHRNNCGPTDL